MSCDMHGVTDEEGVEGLPKKPFTVLVKDMCREAGTKIPSSKDLDMAFELADEDEGGTVDLKEFIRLYAQVVTRRGRCAGALRC